MPYHMCELHMHNTKHTRTRDTNHDVDYLTGPIADINTKDLRKLFVVDTREIKATIKFEIYITA